MKFSNFSVINLISYKIPIYYLSSVVYRKYTVVVNKHAIYMKAEHYRFALF